MTTKVKSYNPTFYTCTESGDIVLKAILTPTNHCLAFPLELNSRSQISVSVIDGRLYIKTWMDDACIWSRDYKIGKVEKESSFILTKVLAILLLYPNTMPPIDKGYIDALAAKIQQFRARATHEAFVEQRRLRATKAIDKTTRTAQAAKVKYKRASAFDGVSVAIVGPTCRDKITAVFESLGLIPMTYRTGIIGLKQIHGDRVELNESDIKYTFSHVAELIGAVRDMNVYRN